MRVFLALEIPGDIKEYLLAISKRISHTVPGVKWVKSEGLHVTLKFIGEIDEAMVRKIEDSLADIGQHHRTATLQFKEISAFPDLRRARVIVVAFQEGVDKVQAIFHDIETRLSVPELHDSEAASSVAGQTRAFIPHITLGRVKGAVPLLKRDIIPLEEKRFLIDTIVLYRSTLTQAGAIYTPLKEIKLERNV